MPQYQNKFDHNEFGRGEFDHDKTSILLSDSGRPPVDELPFTPVAVAPGRQAPRNAPYLAQQTSFDEYTPGLNPLVNAASHLLLEMVRLRHAREIDLEALRSRLEAEIRGFNAQAIALGITESQVNAAQYLLCTALDESVTTSAIPDAQNSWQHKSLLSTFHKDTWGGEVFFDVLGRTMEQPASRLYLLELIYLLLSLGFEGKYRLQEKGILKIEALRDQLYRQIRLLRGEASPDLSRKLAEVNIKDKIYAYVPRWAVVAVVVFCLSITWWVFSYALSSKAGPLLRQYEAQAPAGKPFASQNTQQENPARAENAAPQNTGPENAGPENAAPANTEPQNAGPQSAAPQSAAKENSPPEDTAPKISVRPGTNNSEARASGAAAHNAAGPVTLGASSLNAPYAAGPNTANAGQSATGAARPTQEVVK